MLNREKFILIRKKSPIFIQYLILIPFFIFPLFLPPGLKKQKMDENFEEIQKLDLGSFLGYLYNNYVEFVSNLPEQLVLFV